MRRHVKAAGNRSASRHSKNGVLHFIYYTIDSKKVHSQLYDELYQTGGLICYIYKQKIKYYNK